MDWAVVIIVAMFSLLLGSGVAFLCAVYNMNFQYEKVEVPCEDGSVRILRKMKMHCMSRHQKEARPPRGVHLIFLQVNFLGFLLMLAGSFTNAAPSLPPDKVAYAWASRECFLVQNSFHACIVVGAAAAYHFSKQKYIWIFLMLSHGLSFCASLKYAIISGVQLLMFPSWQIAAAHALTLTYLAVSCAGTITGMLDYNSEREATRNPPSTVLEDNEPMRAWSALSRVRGLALGVMWLDVGLYVSAMAVSTIVMAAAVVGRSHSFDNIVHAFTGDGYTSAIHLALVTSTGLIGISRAAREPITLFVAARGSLMVMQVAQAIPFLRGGGPLLSLGAMLCFQIAGGMVAVCCALAYTRKLWGMQPSRVEEVDMILFTDSSTTLFSLARLAGRWETAIAAFLSGTFVVIAICAWLAQTVYVLAVAPSGELAYAFSTALVYGMHGALWFQLCFYQCTDLDKQPGFVWILSSLCGSMGIGSLASLLVSHVQKIQSPWMLRCIVMTRTVSLLAACLCLAWLVWRRQMNFQTSAFKFWFTRGPAQDNSEDNPAVSHSESDHEDDTPLLPSSPAHPDIAFARATEKTGAPRDAVTTHDSGDITPRSKTLRTACLVLLLAYLLAWTTVACTISLGALDQEDASVSMFAAAQLAGGHTPSSGIMFHAVIMLGGWGTRGLLGVNTGNTRTLVIGCALSAGTSAIVVATRGTNEFLTKNIVVLMCLSVALWLLTSVYRRSYQRLSQPNTNEVW